MNEAITGSFDEVVGDHEYHFELVYLDAGKEGIEPYLYEPADTSCIATCLMKAGKKLGSIRCIEVESNEIVDEIGLTDVCNVDEARAKILAFADRWVQ